MNGHKRHTKVEIGANINGKKLTENIQTCAIGRARELISEFPTPKPTSLSTVYILEAREVPDE